jgi:acyl-CoA-binding protein
MKPKFTPGQRALVVGKHPHAGSFVSLASFGPYGLEILNLVGWLVRGDDSQEFYCQEEQLAPLAGDESSEEPLADVLLHVPQGADLVPADVQVVEAEEQPTVSPGRRETTLDRLRAYFKKASDGDKVVLSQHQLDVLERLEHAWSLTLEARTNEDAAKKLMRRFSISRAQAYRDLTDSKQLFGDATKSSKEADRYLLKEMGLDTFRKARKAGELDQMNKALANLVKITGIEKDDPNIPDAQAYMPSNYVLELKSKQGQDLTLNLETIAQLPAHQFEEVMDIIQESGGVSELEMMQKILEAARGTVE